MENRAEKIRDVVPPAKWRHVPGSVNPADVCTRKINTKDILPDSIWFTGPKFLYLPPEHWPTTSLDDNVTLELKSTLPATINLVTLYKNNFGEVIKVDNCSSLHRLFVVIALVLRFVGNILAKSKNREKKAGCLSSTEYKEAERNVIKYEQDEISRSEKFLLLKKSLNLFYDEEGVIRLRGRLENSGLQFETKFPILLKDGHFTRLQILKCHLDLWHGGVESTLTLFRDRFWVVRGRQVVKRVINRCVKCKRHQSQGLLPPSSPPLPIYRVSADYCFETSGSDFAGPLLVKSIYGHDSKLHKAYICIFTCATSRAIHLEVTPDLEAESYIRAFRRFVFPTTGKPVV